MRESRGILLDVYERGREGKQVCITCSEVGGERQRERGEIERCVGSTPVLLLRERETELDECRLYSCTATQRERDRER
jgi:hypothetical protein